MPTTTILTTSSEEAEAQSFSPAVITSDIAIIVVSFVETLKEFNILFAAVVLEAAELVKATCTVTADECVLHSMICFIIAVVEDGTV